MRKRILYISYDGMTDPLGQSQVISYLVRLSEYGYHYTLISFEKEERFEQGRETVEQFIQGKNIDWIPLRYHKNPPILSSLWDIRAGKREIRSFIESDGLFDLVHCRGYMSAIMGRWAKRRYGVPFLFDMRGWWADEKMESGHWDSTLYKPVYRYFKTLERSFFKESKRALSLTYVGRQAIDSLGLKPEAEVGVIPTCVNFDVFPEFSDATRFEVRKELGLAMDEIVMLYSGSVGGNYRIDLVLEFFKQLLAQRPEQGRFVFLTHSPEELVEQEITKSGIGRNKIVVVSSSYNRVHRYLMAADIGVIMYNTDFSVKGRSPTKMGEYWSAGMPVLSSCGIGDLEAILQKYPGGGVLVPSLDELDTYGEAVQQVLRLDSSREELRRMALEYFNIDNGVESYHNLYQEIITS